MNPILDVRNITKQYEGHRAVDGVSFSVGPSRIFGLLGPNGAGKTTSIRMIMDIIAPDSGTILFSGQPRTSTTNAAIGYLPEERGLYRKMSVRDHLVFLAEIRGMRKSDALPRIDRWLDRLGLEDWAAKKVEELSKGMQQKVQFIGTVINEPPLLILDEPFSGLDPINTNLLKELIAEASANGTAIIFSTHVLEQAEKLCDDICLIKSGRVILNGPLADVREQFRRPTFWVKGRDVAALKDLDMVRGIESTGDAHVVELTDKSHLDGFLEAALARSALTEFRRHEPDLNSIFMEAVEHATG